MGEYIALLLTTIVLTILAVERSRRKEHEII